MESQSKEFRERFVVYTRVSTLGQGDNTSPDSQLESCKRYGESQGWALLENGWFHDTVSGTKRAVDRESITNLLDLIENKTVKHIIIRKVDRIAREQAVLKDIITQVYSLGGIVSIADKGRTYKNVRECLKDIKLEGFFAEFEWDSIVEKNLDGRIEQFKKGSSVFKLPYGYVSRNATEGGKKFKVVSINIEEANALVDMLEHFSKSRGIKATLDYAREQGYKSRKGFDFAHHTFRDTINLIDAYSGLPFQESYHNKMTGESFTREFSYPAIISQELRSKVREAMDRKSKVPYVRNDGAKPYDKLIFCSYCGAPARIRMKSKSKPKLNGEVYSSFIISCSTHHKMQANTYRLEGKSSADQCGKSFRYTEVTNSLLAFLDEASEVGTPEGYARELSRTLLVLARMNSRIKIWTDARNNLSRQKDIINKNLSKLMEVEGADIPTFVAEFGSKLKELQAKMEINNLEIAGLKKRFNELAAILTDSGLDITDEFLDSLKPLKAKAFVKAMRATKKGESLTQEEGEEVMSLALVPQIVLNLADELSRSLLSLKAVILSEDWEQANTFMYRLGIRVDADFNEPMHTKKIPKIKVSVRLGEGATQLIRSPNLANSENTTRGHALKNIPVLREALEARGVPVWTPDPEDVEDKAGKLF